MEITGYGLLWLFVIYSFLGWCLEVCAAALKRRRLINRGFLNGPFCLLYGAGAVVFEIILPELRDSLVFLFLGGMILGSFLEYWSGRTMEKIFHRKWWDYSKQKFQLDGYICLQFAAVWGLGAVLMMKVADPLLLDLVHFIPRRVGEIALWVLYGVILLDWVGSAAALLELHHKMARITQLSEDLQKMSDSLGNAITRRIQHRMMGAYPNIALPNLIEERRAAQAAQKEKERSIFGYGCSFYKLASLFFIGSFLGDIVETIFCYVRGGVLMSRSSVVYGPFSIVWGLGCVLLTMILYRYRDRSDRVIFLAGTVLGGAYEYVCSVFTELMFGTVFWDYSELPFNLGGRINLLYCFFWGIAAVVWLKMIYPPISRWIEKIPARAGRMGCNLLILFMVFDILLTGAVLIRFSQRQAAAAVETEAVSGSEAASGTGAGPGTEAAKAGGPADNWLNHFLDSHFPDERVEKRYQNMKIVD